MEFYFFLSTHLVAVTYEAHTIRQPDNKYTKKAATDFDIGQLRQSPNRSNRFRFVDSEGYSRCCRLNGLTTMLPKQPTPNPGFVIDRYLKGLIHSGQQYTRADDPQTFRPDLTESGNLVYFNWYVLF